MSAGTRGHCRSRRLTSPCSASPVHHRQAQAGGSLPTPRPRLCLATTGLALRRGTPMAIVLGFPWLAITVAAELLVARHWRRERPTWAATAPVVTFAYLVFAAAWLLLELGARGRLTSRPRSLS